MFNRSMTTNVQKIITQHINANNNRNLIAVDATLGNGFDLEFLNAQNHVGLIYGFDIQEQAIEESKKKVLGTDKEIKFIWDSHHNFKKYIEEYVDIVLFNLGYLPKGDKNIVTQYESTLSAIEQVLEQLNNGGIMSIMTYPGHEEGLIEDQKIDVYLSSLQKKELAILKLSVQNVTKAAPNAYIITKS